MDTSGVHVIREKDRRGEIVLGHRTEIRSRWTTGNLAFHTPAAFGRLRLEE